jgi:hypothetical protein
MAPLIPNGRQVSVYSRLYRWPHSRRLLPASEALAGAGGNCGCLGGHLSRIMLI